MQAMPPGPRRPGMLGRSCRGPALAREGGETQRNSHVTAWWKGRRTMQARHRSRSTPGQIAGLIALTLVLAWPVRANAERAFTFTATDLASRTMSFGFLDVTANPDGT